MASYEDKSQASQGSRPGIRSHQPAAGKQTLVEQIVAPVVQQRTADKHDPRDEAAVHAAASQGVATPASPLPFSDVLQRAFGRHDVSSIRAHTGSEAALSARAMGAEAYATSDHVVLEHGATLHTVAHEAAHVVQQRGGVQLKGGVGAVGDAYERHADAVADRVVTGQSAEDLLDQGAASVAPGASQAVQRKEGKDDAQILENQARLKGTDVEIPALEGALLATRKEAVKLGLLSKASFDAGLVLSQAMTQLQPAVTAKGAVDPGLQERAAVYEKLPETSIDEWKTNNPSKPPDGLTRREGQLYMQRGEIDMMVVERQPSTKARVIAREEIKTGSRDTNADARGQLGDQPSLLRDAAAGKKTIQLEVGDRDITSEIDLASDATASKSTRGPAEKSFDKSLGVTASDLEALGKDLLNKSGAAEKGAP